MTLTQAVNLASAAMGIAGTIAMYRGTFGLAPIAGFMYSSEAARATQEANRHRERLQRVGLALLMVSFALQGVAQFTPA
ncbi:hypothetical protein [Burkholderia gladioli]|uniref:hypothetical protein n=1 Tax=Burkholderia gladioli TaxID=28095 RepID=UPI00163F922B|nr:hypothetical protein [Burkholderia gladioli]